MVLETEKSKIKALNNLVFGEGPLPNLKKVPERYKYWVVFPGDIYLLAL